MRLLIRPARGGAPFLSPQRAIESMIRRKLDSAHWIREGAPFGAALPVRQRIDSAIARGEVYAFHATEGLGFWTITYKGA